VRQHQGHGAAVHRLDRASQKALFYIFNEAFGLIAGSKLEELGLVFNPFERSLQPMRARLT
jgi:hypothetical protein